VIQGKQKENLSVRKRLQEEMTYVRVEAGRNTKIVTEGVKK
jgi:hypothetical protein